VSKINKISLIIVGAIILFIVAQFLFIEKSISKVEIPYQITRTIDSLKSENIKLELQAKSYDSVIITYKLQINILDSQIVVNQSKFNTFKRNANIKSDKVKKYTLTQVDSFFKDRYNY